MVITIGTVIVGAIGAAAVKFSYDVVRQKGKNNVERFLEKAPEPSREERLRIQLVAMRVEQTYIRDKNRVTGSSSSSPPNPELLDVQDNQFWTSMKNCGVSEEEQRKVGLAHYLRRDNHPEVGVAPRLVITCRGTIASFQDIADDFRVGFHLLHNSKRYQKSEELILKLVEHFRANYEYDGPSDIWVAGHSLGADIALKVGMTLAAKRMKVTLCCFNCPLLTALSIAQDVLLVKALTNTLWTIKEILENLSKTLESETDEFVDSANSYKLACALLTHGEDGVMRQLNQLKNLQMGPILMCVNKGDYVCKQFFKFYRRNHGKGRFHVSFQAWLAANFLEEENPRFFHALPMVTMFLSRESLKPPNLGEWLRDILVKHGLKQWHSDIKMKKIEFNLDKAF